MGGTPGAPNMGSQGHPQFLYLFTAAEGGGFPNGRQRHPEGGAEVASPSEGEGNPAEGGCFTSAKIILYIYVYHIVGYLGYSINMFLMRKVHIDNNKNKMLFFFNIGRIL